MRFNKRGFESFRRSLVFSIYCSRWLTTEISWSGYLKSTIGSRWCPVRDCFNNSGTKVVTLSASNIIKSMFKKSNVWSLCRVIIHRRIARKYKTLFKSHCFKALRLFIYLRATDTSHVVEYLGRAGLKLKTPFKNLHNKSNSPSGISFHWCWVDCWVNRCKCPAYLFLVDGRHDASSMSWAFFEIPLLSAMNLSSDKLLYLFYSTWGAQVLVTVAVSEDFS